MIKKVFIRVFSHGISVKPIDVHAKNLLRDFCRTVAEWEYKKSPPTWKAQLVMTRVYNGCTRTRSDFRFHASQLGELLKHFQYGGINKDSIEIVTQEMYTPVSIKMDLKLHDPYDYQEPVIAFGSRTDLPTKVVHLQTGKGKAQSLKSRIKVPGGWMKMGDMKVGQEIITPSGEIAKVNGVFPQGKKQLYTVTFADGRQTKACAEHLWNVKESSEDVWSIVDTMAILGALEQGNSAFVPLVSNLSEQNADVSLYETRMVEAQLANEEYQLVLTNRKKAEWIQYLVREKGGLAKLTSKKSTHYLSISFKYDSLQILSVVPYKVELAQCISIDHPEHLYVTDDFIVTHNTLSALHMINNLNVRALLQLRGGYVGRWVPDILESLGITAKKNNGEVIVVRGSKDLHALIQNAKAGLISPNVKFVVITNKTIYELFKEYEDNTLNNYYGIEPHEIYQLLGIGLAVIDEVHEDFHNNYRAHVYSHIPSRLNLSATLDTENSTRRRMYDILFSPESYAPAVKYDAYIDVCAVHFTVRPLKAFKLQHSGNENYSHQAFEESLMVVPGAFDNYMELIKNRLGVRYFDPYESGQKALLFFRLTAVCDRVVAELRALYPDMVINPFYSGISEDILTSSDIIVSTVESCGTARDIPNLAYAMLTRAVRKLETNEQIKGRLRKLKNYKDRDPYFDYFVCDNIDKHVTYHREKKEQFKSKAKAHYDAFPRIVI